MCIQPIEQLFRLEEIQVCLPRTPKILAHYQGCKLEVRPMT